MISESIVKIMGHPPHTQSIRVFGVMGGIRKITSSTLIRDKAWKDLYKVTHFTLQFLRRYQTHRTQRLFSLTIFIPQTCCSSMKNFHLHKTLENLEWQILKLFYRDSHNLARSSHDVSSQFTNLSYANTFTKKLSIKL